MDVVNLAHTTIVVDTPGMGDDIQSIKAGILEIADILVVNKADHPGADTTMRNLNTMVQMGHRSMYSAHKHGPSKMGISKEAEQEELQWIPPVIKTIAAEKEGIDRLVEAVQRHAVYLHESGQWEQKEALALRETIQKTLSATLFKAWQQQAPNEAVEAILALVSKREISPQEAVFRLLAL